MSATNLVAEGIEELGVRTFSAKEMAFNILGLMHPLVFDVAQIEPVWADVSLSYCLVIKWAVTDARAAPTAQWGDGQIGRSRCAHD